ncbi:OFA family MFS transporter [Xanthomonas rydalmerensis]|uniref:OFA family MFS transporter n=1 Tax=Xanthomonas rydalmerensis TaxID=3046274 RepID=A0ABZ0JR53_9XANT|nr:OFA family MFS transporter [Xanthomonas sp. DM-2023]WOS42308.1 OFA family MFS transporter [Xanthomonas sp. DM-2023]WOS46495.1 OFA family MFS transporter [Xanthomonas sp. DM-2023]WOS50674.1 OFA family MFS transporter [Xanthomonas sp. DM-2023]WOS54854.1 OFA family MFS transporter [Xanthomonas sp. DM-2023]WOS59037.1 OFA family MFS transporter [Xanthomonas sp. DM-2023]
MNDLHRVAGSAPTDRAGLLSKERIVAGPGFNRWLVPPAALAIHLCIGMAYGFSVFWLPLSKALGITEAVACPADMGFLARIVSASCDWKISELQWMYTLFFVLLGCSAALWGGWLERAGPRKAGVVAALCWCGGLVISALGIHLHQIWLLWLGSGVIGGIGLGLGYISPVSTLIKWFPDRRGMATGMAIMGFGGGAMIGSPLADALMRHFAGPGSVGVKETFLVMAGLYFVFMMAGAFGYRVPPSGWTPAGWSAPTASANAMITANHVHVRKVWGIPQFWLLWGVLCLNVSAGIGVIGMASPMLQEVFGGRLIGVNAGFASLDPTQLAAIAAIAAGFTGLLSLFNIGGRFFWASMSDKLGRKHTYSLFFVLGIALYAAAPWAGKLGGTALFVGIFCVIVSMYGGGFATIPAYLADLFGTQMVGAIHGRLLTAWATAGILGPVVVGYMREYQLGMGVPPSQVYNTTMYILAGMLVLGLICNLLVRPVAARHFMTPEELAAEKLLAHERVGRSGQASPDAAQLAVVGRGGNPLLLALAWLAVGLPMLWGIWVTLQKAFVLFH